MTLVLLLILFCGAFTYVHSQFKAEEGQSLVLNWNSPRPLDLSSIYIDCNCLSTSKSLLRMIEGEEKGQDAQFSGRVQCDREALREGQVRLRLTHLTALDSGKYFCHMVAKSDSWRFEFDEHFVIQVLPSETITALTTPDAVTKQTESQESVKNRAAVIGVGIGIGIGIGILHLFVFPIVTDCDIKSRSNSPTVGVPSNLSLNQMHEIHRRLTI